MKHDGICRSAAQAALAISMIFGSATALAETGKKALVLSSSVSGGASSSEAQRATALGFAVTVIDDAAWQAMTAAQFADYQLLIIGDPACGSLSPAVVANAVPLANAVMARAGGNTKVGNRVLIGTDPIYHYSQGGNKLIDTAIDFAGTVDGATNLFMNFTCGDPDRDGNGKRDGEEKLLPLLTQDTTPDWTQNPSAPCGGDVSLISNADQFATLTSTNLRGWSCSVHESFPTFPADFSPLAIATDTPTRPICGTDVDTGESRCGEAYVLIAGTGISVASPNLSLAPLNGAKSIGSTHSITAHVTNPDDTPRSGQLVEFLVTGSNSGAAGSCVPTTCKSDASGNVKYSYKGTVPGSDTVNASMLVDGSRQIATAIVTWAGVLAKPTKMTAGPLILGLSGLTPTLAAGKVSATLVESGTGLPVRQANVRFLAGTKLLCQAKTNNLGVATCSPPVADLVGAVLNLGYRAVFNSTSTLVGSSANGELVRIQ